MYNDGGITREREVSTMISLVQNCASWVETGQRDTTRYDNTNWVSMTHSFPMLSSASPARERAIRNATC